LKALHKEPALDFLRFLVQNSAAFPCSTLLPYIAAQGDHTMTRSNNSLLLNYRQRNGMLFFRVADSPDYDQVVRELKRRIPARARRFSSQTMEWAVNLEYREAVEELFSGALVLPESNGKRSATYNRSGAGGQIIWLVLALTGILTTGAILWARQPVTTAALPVPTVVATVPMPTLAAQPATSEASVNSEANLRAGPGLLFAVTAQAKHGDRFSPLARAQDPDGFWWLKVADDRWIRSDLVVSAAPGELPLDLSLIPIEGAQ